MALEIRPSLGFPAYNSPSVLDAVDEELLEISGAVRQGEGGSRPEGALPGHRERVVKGAGAALGAKPDEVAILVLTPTASSFASRAAPVRRPRHDPVSKRDSIAWGPFHRRAKC